MYKQHNTIHKMKQILTFLALICSYMLCGAQATTLTIDNKVAGTMSQRILYEDKLTVENLIILGEINADDMAYINELNSNYNLTGTIDMSNVNVVSGGRYLAGNSYLSTTDNSLNVRMFSTDKKIKKLVVPRTITTWDDGTYYVANGSAGTATYHSYLNVDSLVIDCPNLNTISNGIGSPSYLYVGEGVKSLNIASKYLDRLPGASDDYYRKAANTMCIYLPESLSSLYGHKRMGTPKMTIYSKLLRPDNLSVGSNNWEQDVLTNGIIYAPNDTKEYYEMSIFKYLDIIAPISVKGVSLDVDAVEMSVGETRCLNATITPTDANNQTIIWNSSNEAIASVDENGLITAQSRGEAVITATSDENANIQTTCSVVVKQQVNSVSISHNSLTLEKDASFQLYAQIIPENANIQNVNWYSSNEVIATVSDKGVITALKPGQTTIWVETIDGNHTAECALTVIQPVESVSVTPKSLTMNVGETSSVTAEVLPTNSCDKAVIWQSSDEHIVKIIKDGKIVALSNGNIKVYAYSNYNHEIKDFCEVTVLQPTTGILLDHSEIEIIEDESMQLLATILPENASNKSVNWTSSDISIAMVSPDGKVFGIKAGEATIMATTVDGGFVALCKVIVKAKAVLVSNIELSANSETMAIGETVQLNAIISPNNASNKTINWTSTNPQIAAVNDAGLVTALAEGKTQIIATTADGSNLSAICEITVEKQFINITRIEITPSNANIAVGHSLSLGAVITPDNSTNKAIAWSSTNPAVATVSETGVVTAVSEGDAIIIASTQDGSNLSAMCHISVYAEAILVESIDLSPSRIEGDVNETYQINATVLPANATNKTIAWTSSDDSVASVEDGLVKLNALGTAIITAVASDGSNVKSECAIVVSHEAGIDSIITDKDSYVKIFNLSGYLVYEGVYSDAKLAPGFYIVICNDSSVETIIK